MSFTQRHWRHVFLVGLLTLTGFSLYLTQWRSALGPLLPISQALHDWGGVLYGIALLGWSTRFFPWPTQDLKAGSAPPFVKWVFFFLVMLFVSGIGLLIGPSWTRAIATVVHGIFAGALVIWVGYHLIKNLPIRRQRVDGSSKIVLSRRRLIRWMLGAGITLPVMAAVPSVLTMASGRIFRVGSNHGALPGFVPYTVSGGYPAISLDAYRLTVGGLASPRHYQLSDLTTLGEITRHINFQCVTGWAVDGVEFKGVDLRQFLLHVGWNPKKHPWLTFYSGDGVYTESLSSVQIEQYRPLLAYKIDGEPLPRTQGYPLRLVVPGMYGYKSIKWLVRIDLVNQDSMGYWEQRGYPQNAYLGSYS